MTPPYPLSPHGLQLTTAEAADQLRCSTRTIRRWIKAGKFPHHSRPGGQWRIPQADVTALMGPV